jgi:hypothetical protein
VQDQDPASRPRRRPPSLSRPRSRPRPHRLLTRLLTRSSNVAAPTSGPPCRACPPHCSIRRRRFEAIFESSRANRAYVSAVEREL